MYAPGPTNIVDTDTNIGTATGMSIKNNHPQPAPHDIGSLDNTGSLTGGGGVSGSAGQGSGSVGANGGSGSMGAAGGVGACGSGNLGGGNSGSVGAIGASESGGLGAGSESDRHRSYSASRSLGKHRSDSRSRGTDRGIVKGKISDLESGIVEVIRKGEFTSPVGISTFGALSMDNFGCDV